MTRKTAKKKLVWLVDDTAEHHDTARATMGALPGWELVGYLDAAAAVRDFAAIVKQKPRNLPEVVLMDFFLGDTHGNVVTAELRALQPVGAPLTIVGYSSVASASAAIVAAGGDMVVRKHRDERGMNPSLERFLATYPH
jgi:ActR/RegA family two-component response regulator